MEPASQVRAKPDGLIDQDAGDPGLGRRGHLTRRGDEQVGPQCEPPPLSLVKMQVRFSI